MISRPRMTYSHGNKSIKETHNTNCRNCRINCIKDPSDHFHSVEFSANGSNLLYQSKLWNDSTESMFALVKENSDVLSWIHVGDVLNMKYYTRDALCPIRNFDTRIEYITKDMEGRFRGHYLVGLEILSEHHPNHHSTPAFLDSHDRVKMQY